jgi:hypothetical protein
MSGYPSAPLLLRSWTAGQFPGCRVVTQVPANLQQVLGQVEAVVRVQRFGGPRAITLDYPLLDVDVFAADLDTADRICGLVCNAWEFTMPGQTIDAGVDGAAVVAKVEITAGPSVRPVTDSTLSRVGASARVILHALAT